MYREAKSELQDYVSQLETAKRATKSFAEVSRDLAREREATLLSLRTATLSPEEQRAKQIERAQQLHKQAEVEARLEGPEKARKILDEERRIYETAAREVLRIQKSAQDELLRMETQLAERKGVASQQDLQARVEAQRKIVTDAQAEATAHIDAVEKIFLQQEAMVEKQRKDAEAQAAGLRERVRKLQQQLVEIEVQAQKEFSLNLSTSTAMEELDALLEKLHQVREESGEITAKTKLILEKQKVFRESATDVQKQIAYQTVNNVDNSKTDVTINVDGAQDPKEITKQIKAELERIETRRQ